MITSIFKKSTPINYSLIGILMILLFFIFQFNSKLETHSFIDLLKKGALLVVLVVSLFLCDFIVKKNGLTKNSSYTILFFFILLLFFPKIFNNSNLLLANFFVILSIRRLISLQTLKFPKEKIFDASIWIFVASLFHFWTIIFLLLVYISIIFHVSRDYRNWLIPFVALFVVAVIFVFYNVLLDNNAVNAYLQNNIMNFSLDYFTNNNQNIAFSIFTVFLLFFLVPFIFSINSKPLNLQASYKKVVFAAFFGIIIFLISDNKSNEILVFTFLPIAIIATNTIEYFQNKIQQEIILFISIACGFYCFFSQL
ncbi:DUF6427 family protein [Flavobacterium sp.]|jgi:hypothetical protein|uniref:DUF6427 family protein n=1 Tax=Flavobacterium sp. TaxID=239 RepID=UPI003BBB1E60